ncbi:MAG: EamA family transporter, partial [Acidobacteriota bacterium]
MSLGTARLLALAAALLFSTGGAAIKTGAFSAAQVSSARSGIAALALVLWLGGRVRWSSRAAAIGLVYALVLTAFVAATRLTTAANAIFLQATAPLYIVLLGPLVLGERVRRRDLVYMAVVGAGIGLCFIGQPPPSAIASNPRL